MLVVGDIMLDKYVFGKVERISPEAPVPVLHVVSEKYHLGGAANVAHNLSKLGAAVQLCGLLGKDEAGSIFQELLQQQNITSKCAFQAQYQTIVKTRLVAQQHQLLRVDYESTPTYNAESLLKVIHEIFNSNTPDCILISDYKKGVCSNELCKEIITKANAANVKVLVDPKANDWHKYNGAFLIKPNFSEFTHACGKQIENKPEVIIAEAKKLLQLFNIENILITRSEEGMILVGKDEIFSVAANAKEVYDVTGAGDTVLSVLGYLLCNGYHLKEAVSGANDAAAIAISKFGTYAVTPDDLQSILSKLKLNAALNKVYA